MSNNINMEEIVEELDKIMINYDLTPEQMINVLDTYADGLGAKK